MPILIVRRVKVSLKLFRWSVSFLITYGFNVNVTMTGNSFFATPPVTLTALVAALTALQSAAVKTAQTGGPGTTAAMKAAQETVINLLTALRHYVEDIANEPINTGNATVIILSAGMLVKSFNPRQKQGYALLPGKLFGTVDVTAEAVQRGVHEWQYSVSLGPLQVWSGLPSTTKAKTTITGLTSATVVYVRHRAILKGGPTNWDAVLSVIVP